MTGLCRNNVCYEQKTADKKLTGNKVHYVYTLIKIRSKFIVFLLALLPLLFEGSSSQQLFYSLLLQLFALTAVLLSAIVSRHYLRWEYDKRFIKVCSGFINRREISIPVINIHSASIIRTPVLCLFRAVRLELRSTSSVKKPEITLYLSPDEANYLASSIMQPSAVTGTLNTRTLPFLLTSASRANFAAGITISAVFILSFGKAFDDISPEKLYSSFSETAAYILPYLPPVISLLSGILLLGWTVHYLSICFSDARQTVTASDTCIFIVRGLISTSLTCIRKSSITSCEIRKTALTALFKQSIINLTAFGNKGSGTYCALAAIPSSDSESMCHSLSGIGSEADITLNASRKHHLIWWLPYASLSAVFCVLIIKNAAGMVLSAMTYLYVFGFLLSVWRCIVGIIGSVNGKIELSGQHIAITSVRRFSLCTVKIYMGKIARFVIIQSILQKRRGLCSVRIKASGAKYSLICRNLSYDAMRILSERIK